MFITADYGVVSGVSGASDLCTTLFTEQHNVAHVVPFNYAAFWRH